MYIGSSALQQRFVPQPLMRSSWQQLVMFGLEPGISFYIPVPSTGMTVLFFLLSSSDKRSAFLGSLDIMIKSGNDKKKNKSGNDR